MKETIASETLVRSTLNLPPTVFFRNPYNADFVRGDDKFPVVVPSAFIELLIGLTSVIFSLGIFAVTLIVIGPLFKHIHILLGICVICLSLSVTVSYPIIALMGVILQSAILARRFQSRGQLLHGEIVYAESSPQTTFKKAKVEIEYQFAQPSGTPVYKKIQVPPGQFDDRSLPEPHTPIYVLYFNDKDHYLL